MKKVMKSHSLTEGPILKTLLLFSVPMIAGNLLQQIYNITDTLIVGRFVGANALAAVGSAYTLMTFITSVIIGLSMGSGTLFSMNFGAGDKKSMAQDIGCSFLFILAVTLVIVAAVFPLTDYILHILQTPEEVYDPMRVYTRVIFMGIPFIFLYNFFAYLLRSMGNSVIPLVFLIISSILNIILDLVFVICFGMGVKGAAAATVIAQGLSGVGIFLYALIRVPLLRDRKSLFVFSGKRMLYIIKTDLLTCMQQSVMNFGILMIQGLVNSFGAVIMASFAAAVKIDTLAYMPAQEFGNAYSLFISQNFGAKKEERVRKCTVLSMITSAVFCVFVSTLVCLFARPLIGIFLDPSEMEIITAGVRYLKIEGACYLGIGILFLWYGYYRGIQIPEMSLVLTVISLGTRVLFAYTLAPNTPLGVTAIWLAIPIGWSLADLTGLGVFIVLKQANAKKVKPKGNY